MKFRERMNRAVFGLVAVALQFLPGKALAEADNECSDEFQAVRDAASECLASGMSAGDCLNCLQASNYQTALCDLEACVGSQPLIPNYPLLCNDRPGGTGSSSGYTGQSGSYP